MTNYGAADAVGNLILVYLLSSKTGSETESKLAKDLAPLAERHWSGTEWTALGEAEERIPRCPRHGHSHGLARDA